MHTCMDRSGNYSISHLSGNDSNCGKKKLGSYNWLDLQGKALTSAGRSLPDGQGIFGLDL